jgi:ParB family transcriptional regulator, chromosome partitioning protein
MSTLSTSSNSILGLIEELDMSKIRPSTFCLRRGLDKEIDDLASSILQNGLLQPVIVRMRENYFEVVAGNRRYNACRRLGIRRIISHIVEVTDKEAFEVSLTENVQKRTLSPIDEALAFKNYVNDYGWGGVSDLARKLGKSTSYVSKRIDLLDLPSEMINSILDSSIDTSTAEELFYVKDKSKRSQLAQLISTRKLSLRKARQLRKDLEDENSCNLSSPCMSVMDYDLKKAQTSFNKSIITLRIALSKLGSIIQENDGNWLVYELLMQHKNMLHNQIDILIKNKIKYKHKLR